eukprot:TRINITY_DN37119_c0_g1_i1.p1 TRINITY_DN37119_c0_g1~~TRINITY_DN37119_c0_g1_i1.p1  ORF type:complete len:427 (+),score=108.05 TRINITY_DN37119_c0_g1_i1:111-1283(+)
MASVAAQRSKERTVSVKLFIGGLTRNTTTKMLRDHFSEYGNVLDCVAMVQPDGRPRGFGYVTLDSLASAERCLSEPQVIDGRVVDMKRAVPGTSSSGKGGNQRNAAAAPKGKQQQQGAQAPVLSSAPPMMPPGAWDVPAGAFSPTASQIYVAQMAMAAQASAAWAAAWAAATPTGPEDALDCLSMLQMASPVSTTASVCESLNLITGDTSCRSLGSSEWQGLGTSPASGTPTALSASPDDAKCFDAYASALAEFEPSPSFDEESAAPQKITETLKPAGGKRRSVLSDVTNLSPLKVKLPQSMSASILGGASELPVRSGLASFRAKQPSALDIYEDELEADEAAKNVDEEPEQVSSLPMGLSFPPGLSPPRNMKTLVDQFPEFGMAPLMPR